MRDRRLADASLAGDEDQPLVEEIRHGERMPIFASMGRKYASARAKTAAADGPSRRKKAPRTRRTERRG